MLELQALTFLTGLAAAAFAAAAPGGSASRLATAAAFAGSLWLLGGRLGLAPGAAATLLAAGAAIALLRPAARATAVLAGISGALWAMTLSAQELPRVPAVMLAAALVIAAVLLKRRRESFAPMIVQEEALLLLIGLGTLLAVVPPIVEGWRSAVALRAEPLDAPVYASGAWAFVVVGACISLGALYAVWRRHSGGR